MKMKFPLVAVLLTLVVPAVSSAQDNDKDKPEGRRPGLLRPGAGPRGKGPAGRGEQGAPGQPGGPFGGGPGGAPLMAMMKLLPLMTALDTDGDGTLSPSEIADSSKSLMKLDKDGDGAISAEEMKPDMSKIGPPGGLAGAAGAAAGMLQQMSPAMIGKMFETRDANGDGKLSGDEIPERMRERVSMIDTDGDGSLQKSEVEAMATRMMDRAGQRPGRENGSDGSGVKPKRPPE